MQLKENLVASESIDWIDIPVQPLYGSVTTNVLVWNFSADVESDEEIPVKSIEVYIQLKIHCQMWGSESLICAKIKETDDIFDEVRTIFKSY